MKSQPTNSTSVVIFILAILLVQLAKGEIEMNMPKALSTWSMILYFLFVGLGFFGLPIPAFLTGLAALAAAVFLFLGR